MHDSLSSSADYLALRHSPSGGLMPAAHGQSPMIAQQKKHNAQENNSYNRVNMFQERPRGTGRASRT